jgi:GH15 family glucan-1,4-alpha-glucosidase
VADALLHAHLGGIAASSTDIAVQTSFTNHLATIWDQPDYGIWEVRGEPQHFTYSKIMCWVAFDRAVKTAEISGLRDTLNAAELGALSDAVQRWQELRDTIHRDICEKAYDPDLGTFTQAYGSKELDASLLLMPLVGFLPCSDPRVRGTIEAIEKHLMADGFVLRYRTEHVDDGLPPGEGAFLACSFWMVSALKMVGRSDDAQQLFERLLELRNDVGLLAEEFDPRINRQVGNFPQALSHISMINAGFEFNRASSPGQQRADSAAGEQRDTARVQAK